MEIAIWAGIGFCITQSAMFSGLNLAFFSISRLRLHAEAAQRNRNAIRVLEARKDTNFLLTTILWGNVGINVLLTLLSNSVMTGIAAFFFLHSHHHILRGDSPSGLFFQKRLADGCILSSLAQGLSGPAISPCKTNGLVFGRMAR